MRDIVAKCLVKDTSKRPTATQLLEHKFFKVRATVPVTAEPDAACGGAHLKCLGTQPEKHDLDLEILQCHKQIDKW